MQKVGSISNWRPGRAAAAVCLLLCAASTAVAEPGIRRAPPPMPPQTNAGSMPDATQEKAAASDEVSAPKPAARERDVAAQGQKTPKAPLIPVPGGLPDDDYYARRAKERLVEDAAEQAKQMSLQAAYPGHNVVVCEAGCYGRAKRLVQFAPIVSTNPQPPVRVVKPTSGSYDEVQAKPTAAKDKPTAEVAVAAAEPPADTGITCVAGCYGANRGYAAASAGQAQDKARSEVETLLRAGRADAAPAAEAGAARSAGRSLPPRGAVGKDAGRWMTTSTKLDAASDAAEKPAAGNAAAGAAGTGAAAQSATEPKPAGGTPSPKPRKRKTFAKAVRHPALPQARTSGEWFQTINADRALRAN